MKWRGRGRSGSEAPQATPILWGDFPAPGRALWLQSHGWGCTPAIKARTSCPLLKRRVGVGVCLRVNANILAARLYALLPGLLVQSRPQTQSAQAEVVCQSNAELESSFTQFYKRPTWQGDTLMWWLRWERRVWEGKVNNLSLVPGKEGRDGLLILGVSPTQTAKGGPTTLCRSPSHQPALAAHKRFRLFPAHPGKRSVAGIYKRHR